MTKHERTKGFVVFVLDGKEVKEGTPEAKARMNGPHTEAKWAKRLLGTELTSQQRQQKLEREREEERAKKLSAKPTTKPANKKIKAPC